MAQDWTFLTNHAHVLIQLHTDPHARVRDLAHEVGVTERSIMAILSDLEEGGYVTRTRVGRRNHYQVNPQLHFRHPTEADEPVGKLLTIFG